MMPQQTDRESYLADACTIIDYINAKRLDILRLFNSEFGSISVSSISFQDEIISFNSVDYKAIGLKILDFDWSIVDPSVQVKGISIYDLSNLLLAQENKLTLITSDKKLLRIAATYGVKTIRNLTILKLLFMRGMMTPEDAMRVAREIARTNSYITPAILQDFSELLKGA